MGRTFAAVAGGVALGIAVAFANAGAFQFPWGSGDQPAKPNAIAPKQTAQTHLPAPPNAPEPTEKAVALPSWAPLVKHVMPTVVNIAVTQEVKSSGMPFGGPEEGGWWFDAGELVRTVRVFKSEERAVNFAIRLNHRLTNTLNRGRREISSVLSTGRYTAEIHNDAPPPFYPESRPYYG